MLGAEFGFEASAASGLGDEQEDFDPFSPPGDTGGSAQSRGF